MIKRVKKVNNQAQNFIEYILLVVVVTVVLLFFLREGGFFRTTMDNVLNASFSGHINYISEEARNRFNP